MIALICYIGLSINIVLFIVVVLIPCKIRKKLKSIAKIKINKIFGKDYRSLIIILEDAYEGDNFVKYLYERDNTYIKNLTSRIKKVGDSGYSNNYIMKLIIKAVTTQMRLCNINSANVNKIKMNTLLDEVDKSLLNMIDYKIKLDKKFVEESFKLIREDYKG